MGTPDFAVPSLARLVEEGYEVAAVVTAPDRPAGRGQQLRMSAIKSYALANNIYVLQPTNLKSPEFHSELDELNANLYIVVAFRMLPAAVWQRPALGTFNLHASLLPQYRGAAPINWAIINGEKETGVTTFFLDEKIDTGKIIAQQKVTIAPNENAGTLHDRLMHIGSELVLSTVKQIESGSHKLTEQADLVEDELKEAPKLTKANCAIDWNQSAEQVAALIRGLSPYPAAWSTLKHKESGKELAFKVFDCEITSIEPMQPGEIKSDNHQLHIGTASLPLCITTIQLAGKRKMETEALLRGFDIDQYKIHNDTL